MGRIYIKYDPNDNLPTNEAILPNQREKEVNVLASAVCVTNEANQNLATPQKELLRWYFKLGDIGFQNMQMVNSYMASEGARKFQGSGEL